MSQVYITFQEDHHTNHIVHFLWGGRRSCPGSTWQQVYLPYSQRPLMCHVFVCDLHMSKKHVRLHVLNYNILLSNGIIPPKHNLFQVYYAGELKLKKKKTYALNHD